MQCAYSFGTGAKIKTLCYIKSIIPIWWSINLASNPSLFKWKYFQADIILQCIRWYLRYSLTYRDLVEMMVERGIKVSHTTIMRWVHQYAPELDKKNKKEAKTYRGFLETRWNLYKDKRQMEIFISSCR